MASILPTDFAVLSLHSKSTKGSILIRSSLTVLPYTFPMHNALIAEVYSGQLCQNDSFANFYPQTMKSSGFQLVGELSVLWWRWPQGFLDLWASIILAWCVEMAPIILIIFCLYIYLDRFSLKGVFGFLGWLDSFSSLGLLRSIKGAENCLSSI